MNTNISEADFSGMVTLNDLKCSDGRTIRKDAFKHNDGSIVPLVWNHQHNDPYNILGHVLLKNERNGVRGYGFFNDTETGEQAREIVKHGDIYGLSIYANQLKQSPGKDVLHGEIREVSLVLAGANPGALIDSINLSHSEDGEEKEALIYTGEALELSHSEEGEDDKDNTSEPENNDDKEAKDIKEEKQDDSLSHSDDKQEPNKEEKMDNNDKTVQEVWDSMNEEQQLVASVMMEEAVNQALEGANEGGDEGMKHNVFDGDTHEDEVLIHDGLNEILKDGKSYGSLRESFIAHAADYGIENIDFFEPEYKNIEDTPRFIDNQPRGWIQTVVSGVHNTPFAKVRMTFADITADEARAKGYIKGKYKKEEVISLLRRQVNPTTIYKKQKFDRDDLVDIDFDVIPWIKKEMGVKLDEEKARAYLFGDGRSSADDDKVREDCIIPIVSDEDLFSIKHTVVPEQDESLEHALITAAVTAQDDYQGSGNLTAFIETKQVTKMLLMEDKFGHRLYPTMNDLAAGMGVSKIEKVPSGVIPNDVYGIIVDLKDYNVGMKDMGLTNFFDDFDIDYNQNKYLLETRQSAALTVPYSAIVLKKNN